MKKFVSNWDNFIIQQGVFSLINLWITLLKFKHSSAQQPTSDMSRHEGVSCDSCLKVSKIVSTNIPKRRKGSWQIGWYNFSLRRHINCTLFSSILQQGNFRGRRYKCLICYDYDLCSTCHESGAATTQHSANHAM